MPTHTNILAMLSGGYAFVGFGTALCALIFGYTMLHGAIRRDSSLRIIKGRGSQPNTPLGEPLSTAEQAKYIASGIFFLCIGLASLVISLMAK